MPVYNPPPPSTPVGPAGGDLTGTYPDPTLAAIVTASGPIGSATVTPILTIDAKGRVTALSSDTTVPTNAAGGDLTGNYPNPTLGTSGVTAATYGDSTHVAQVALDAKGRATGASNVAIAFPADAVSSVFGRTGAVVTATNDYTFAQISGAADAVGGVAWTVVRKGSDTGRNSTTTPTLDPALQFTAASGSTYEAELYVIYVSTAGAGTPDIKTAVGEDNVLRGTSFWYGLTTADGATSFFASTATGSTPAWGTATTNRSISIRAQFLGNGGTWGFLWAQNTSNGNDTTVKAGSVLRYRVIS